MLDQGETPLVGGLDFKIYRDTHHISISIT